MRFLVTIAVTTVACLFSACSSAKECTPEEQYRIEYFTGGGFTGMEQGMTIECSGWVKFWKRTPQSSRLITDSLLLKRSEQKTFAESMNNAAIFGYSHTDAGNMTTTLVLTKADKSTSIAFPSSDIPADLPAAARKILTGIASIHH